MLLELYCLVMVVDKVCDEIGKVVVGQYEFVELFIVVLFIGGYVLVEGVLGIVKIFMVKLLVQLLVVDFSCIQFMFDFMLSDVLGIMVFNFNNLEFLFNVGLIFSNIVFIDEVNCLLVKMQVVFFEVMEEYQVIVDGMIYFMGFLFFVIVM